MEIIKTKELEIRIFGQLLSNRSLYQLSRKVLDFPQ